MRAPRWCEERGSTDLQWCLRVNIVNSCLHAWQPLLSCHSIFFFLGIGGSLRRQLACTHSLNSLTPGWPVALPSILKSSKKVTESSPSNRVQ